MLETYRELLRALAGILQLDPQELLQTEELLAGDLPVWLMYAGDEQSGDVVWFCELGRPPAAQQHEVFALLLEANGLWLGTGGATLGLQQETGKVLLSDRAPLGAISAAGLASALAAFIEVATFWRRWIADPQAALPPVVQGVLDSAA